MIVAFSDLGSRTDAVHASLLVARAIRASGAPVFHISVAADSEEAAVPSVDGVLSYGLPETLRVVRQARLSHHDVVLTLPFSIWREPGLRRLVDVPVATVGPYAEDERMAAGEDSTSSVPEGALPAWYLGCRRPGGGPAASTFTASMSDLGLKGRLLPLTLPALNRSEAEDLSRGVASARLLSSAILLVSALRRIAVDPSVDLIDGLHAANADSRSVVERLRDLADDLEALDRGQGPTASALAQAPVLDGWAAEIAPVRVLRGIASGHPNIAGGRSVVTTQVMATDNATWARTLSRFYVLGMPAGAARRRRLQ